MGKGGWMMVRGMVLCLHNDGWRATREEAREQEEREEEEEEGRFYSPFGGNGAYWTQNSVSHARQNIFKQLFLLGAVREKERRQGKGRWKGGRGKGGRGKTREMEMVLSLFLPIAPVSPPQASAASYIGL